MRKMRMKTKRKRKRETNKSKSKSIMMKKTKPIAKMLPAKSATTIMTKMTMKRIMLMKEKWTKTFHLKKQMNKRRVIQSIRMFTRSMRTSTTTQTKLLTWTTWRPKRRNYKTRINWLKYLLRQQNLLWNDRIHRTQSPRINRNFSSSSKVMKIKSSTSSFPLVSTEDRAATRIPNAQIRSQLHPNSLASIASDPIPISLSPLSADTKTLLRNRSNLLLLLLFQHKPIHLYDCK